MSINQISIFLENRPGALQSMTDLLANEGIDMRALSLAETEGFGIVRIIVENVYNTINVLKENGFICKVSPVVGVRVPDEPGGLNSILKIFTEAGINIEYMYAFLGSKQPGKAYMIFRVPDEKSAACALLANGIRPVEQDDIEEL